MNEGNCMEPPSQPRSTLSFGAEALGEPQPWTVHHRGLEYPGEVTDFLRTYASVEDARPLSEEPYCSECSLPLSEESPARDFNRLIGAAELAMGEYNRRLSSIGVRQVLGHPTREQLDKFINLRHVMAPSALANVLDDEVVEFLLQFLKSG